MTSKPPVAPCREGEAPSEPGYDARSVRTPDIPTDGLNTRLGRSLALPGDGSNLLGTGE